MKLAPLVPNMQNKQNFNNDVRQKLSLLHGTND